MSNNSNNHEQKNENMSTSNLDESIAIIKGKCDLCSKKDGFRGHNLQECKRCHIKVHETCYGMVKTNEKNPNWECLACQATKNGTLPRPTECVLCSVMDGIHAMHPLYDTHGKKGMPVMLPANSKKGLKRRPAWIHTLCAMFVASNPFTKGCVYGCDIDGNYECDTDEEEEDEDEDEEDDDGGDGYDDTKSKKDTNYDDESELMATHHFVIAGKDKGKETAWTRRITECRSLKCAFCGLSDKNNNSLRIPIQCCWNSKYELEEFKLRHPKEDEDCYIAMHVGCAAWLKDDFGNDPQSRRVFFYPGVQVTDDIGEEQFVEPIGNSYCNLHANTIAARKPKPLTNTKTQPLTNTKQKNSKTSPNKNILTHQNNDNSASKNVAALELKRKEKENQAQKEIREKRRQDILQRNQKLSSQMTDDLENTLIQLLQSNAEKTTIVAARKERREYWSKHIKYLKNESFRRMWATVQDNVQSSDTFLDNYSIWCKTMGESSSSSKPTDNDSDNNSSVPMSTTFTTNIKETSNDHSNNQKSNQTDNLTTVKHEIKQSPWHNLWAPNYDGKGFQFDEWDEMQYFDSI